VTFLPKSLALADLSKIQALQRPTHTSAEFVAFREGLVIRTKWASEQHDRRSYFKDKREEGIKRNARRTEVTPGFDLPVYFRDDNSIASESNRIEILCQLLGNPLMLVSDSVTS